MHGSAPTWDGARNLGDLGGLPLVEGGTTVTGRVFRSAAPEWMTSRGWGEARAAGLTTVVDLRNEVERGRTSDHPVVDPDAVAGIRVEHAPTEDPDDEQFLAECGAWLDHPGAWAPNLGMFPEKIARVLTVVADADAQVLIHCAGGRDRTGMIASLLLVLAGTTDDAVVSNYEAGFRGAAQHRGHGWSFHPASGEWRPEADRTWSEQELDVALDDRRPALFAWLRTFDVEEYVLSLDLGRRRTERLRTILVG